jgi:hypothetical protein
MDPVMDDPGLTVYFESESEDDRIEAWRLHVLIEEAGYPVPLAEKLAARHDVDLHQAVELVKAGCKHETAAEILL